MRDLIEALTLLLPYFDEDSYASQFPTHCEHDVLCVFPNREPDDDVKSKLSELGFEWGETDVSGGEPCFYSYTFGSC